MKRALAVAVALCTFGFASFALNITGSWTATVNLIPTISMSSTLTLNYAVDPFTFTSVSTFSAAGLTGQRFGVAGDFGPFGISGNMWFSPTTIAYLAADLTTGFDFGGVAIGLNVKHWTHGNWVAGWGTNPTTCDAQTPPGAGYLLYTFTGKIAPVDLRVRFVDCCTGAQFMDLQVIVTPIPLCCGINLTGTFLFSKAGFQSLSFSGLNVPICCGISMDIGITYTTTAKSVTLTPKFAGIVEGCFEVFGRPQFSTEFPSKWTGIYIDGFRIRCTIADCNYLEYVHVWNNVTSIPAAVRGKLLGACGEYEYLELGFCGAGCCGGKYEVTLRMLWGTVDPGLFGLTRFVGSVKVPIMANFTLNLDFVMPANSVAPCAAPSFSLGWTFTF